MNTHFNLLLSNEIAVGYGKKKMRQALKILIQVSASYLHCVSKVFLQSLLYEGTYRLLKLHIPRFSQNGSQVIDA